MKKNDFRRTGLVRYNHELIMYMEEIAERDSDGTKFVEALRYVFSLCEGSEFQINSLSSDEANKLRELAGMINIIKA